MKPLRTEKTQLLEPLDIARKIARLASDKKAEEVVLLDMRGMVNYCDYFVISSASGARHVKAVADGIDEGLQDCQIRVRFKQGFDSAAGRAGFSFRDQNRGENSVEDVRGSWVLLDLGHVVAHVFEASSREFYGLEHLWQAAPRLDW